VRAPLPVDDVLPEVVAHLRETSSLVLLAPPGAGKTTRLPQALVDQGVVGPKGRVLVLEPRRLAARLAATRIAAERGARLGGEVGYQVRFDDKTSAETRIALVTEGILTRRLQSDPFLDGVDAVVLDEFHERSVHADLGLAFLRELQLTVRPELRLVVMSATLDPAPVRRFLGECPVVESQGRVFPVELRFLERPDERWPVDLAISGARRAVREVPEGDVLVFLPGAGEIRRAQEALQGHLEGIEVCPLYGELDPAAQDRAVAPGPRRKVILSTNIAESSLTIEGVRVVVDVGVHKLNRFEPGLGLDRLVEQRISARSAAQRTGRAGRLGPGVAYRMWTEKEDRAMPQEDLPEIARVDLAPVLLDVLRWSATDPAAFGWFEAPPPAALARALGLLRALGAVKQDGFQLTGAGEKMSQLPLHPRLSALLMHAHRAGRLRDGARLAALVSERDILDRAARATDEVGGSDLELRLERLDGFEADGGGRASGQAFGVNVGAAKNTLAVARRLEQQARQVLGAAGRGGAEAPGQWVLAAYPDRVARRRRPGEDGVVFVGGGGGRLAPESVVKAAPYLVAVEVDAGRGRRADGALVRQASAVERRWLDESGLVERVHAARWNADKLRAEAVVEVRYLGDLVLEERADPDPDPSALAAALAKAAAEDLERALPLTDELAGFLNRYRFLAAHMPELELPPLGPEDRAALLPDLVVGKRSFAELAKEDLVGWLSARLTRAQQGALTSQAPASVPIPSGRQAKLRYEVEGPPVLSVRLQEVFGLYDSPRVAGGRVPVKMELLAPNQRPVQVTQDLASFWRNTYAEVRKELRRRYPKHQWPEDPRDGIATARVRPPRG
jgi:ATP-dependent helicase HrpB